MTEPLVNSPANPDRYLLWNRLCVVIELNANSLEWYLRQDEAFVEYFNEFLSLPVFTLKLVWNSLTLSIELEEDLEGDTQEKPTEIDQILQWTIDHRLSYFLKSDIFFQYKIFRKLSRFEIIVPSSPSISYDEGSNIFQNVQSNDSTSARKKLCRYGSSMARLSFPPIVQEHVSLVRSKSLPRLKNFLGKCNDEDEDKILIDIFQRGFSSGCESVLEFKHDIVEEESMLKKLESLSPSNLSLVSTENLKYEFMYDVSDMKTFTEFLLKMPTAKMLYLFWMEIEVFKVRTSDKKENRTRIFRLIQEHFNSQLTSNAYLLITECINEPKKALAFLVQAQDDLFERIHSYWLPRYLLHCAAKKNNGGFTQQINRSIPEEIFSSLSLVKYLPMLAEQLKMNPKTKSCQKVQQQQEENFLSTGHDEVINKTSSDALLIVVTTDRNAGSPLSTWFHKNCESYVIESLDLLLDLNDLKYDVIMIKDRLLKVCAVWRFYHKYFSFGACPYSSKEEITRIHSHMKKVEHLTLSIVNKIFANIQKKALDVVQPYWLKYCAEDVFPVERSVSTESRQESGLHTFMLKLERCSSKNEKKMQAASEKVRQRSILPNKFRLRRLGGNEADGKDEEKSDESEEENEDFLDNVHNSQMMSSFKNFVQNEEGRGLMNDLLMFLEIETYFSLTPVKALQKNQNALALYKTFFERSRRSANLPNYFIKSVKDKRPSSSNLRDAQQFVLPQLNACFESFFKTGQSNLSKKLSSKVLTKIPHGITKVKDGVEHWKDFSNTTQFSKQMKLLANKKKSRQGDSFKRSTCKDDLQKFYTAIKSPQDLHKKIVEKFRRYLLKCEDTGFPRLEKNLSFYLEVTKFKELFSYFDEISLNRKAEVIVDVFLDSASPPWLQVDISPEMASRISYRVQQCYGTQHSGSSPHDTKDPMIFNQAQKLILEELLPYWSGFLRSLQDSSENKEEPCDTHLERRQRRLYGEFLNFKEKLGPVEVAPSLLKNSNNSNNNISNSKNNDDEENYGDVSKSTHTRLTFSLDGYRWKEDSPAKRRLYTEE